MNSFLCLPRPNEDYILIFKYLWAGLSSEGAQATEEDALL